MTEGRVSELDELPITIVQSSKHKEKILKKDKKKKKTELQEPVRQHQNVIKSKKERRNKHHRKCMHLHLYMYTYVYVSIELMSENFPNWQDFENTDSKPAVALKPKQISPKTFMLQAWHNQTAKN